MRCFKVLVLGTLSSGKSTLINSLIDRMILPTNYGQCTKNITTILMRKNTKEPTILIDNQSYSCKDKFVDKRFSRRIEKAGKKCKKNDVLVKLPNTLFNKDIIFIDTPCTNREVGKSHILDISSIINAFKPNLILGVINANQPLSTPDTDMIEHVAKKEKENFILIFNHMDEIDTEKNSIDKLKNSAKDFLKSKGIKPQVMFVSAKLAEILYKLNNDIVLTRNENLTLREYINYNFGVECSNEQLNKRFYNKVLNNCKIKQLFKKISSCLEEEEND